MNLESGDLEILGRLTALERDLPAPIVTEERLREQCSGDPDLEELLSSALELSFRYAVSVAKFDQIISEEQDDETAFDRINEARGRTHDALIASMNALARNMNARGADGSWVQPIFGNRAGYGKLAILLALHSLQGRQ